MMSSGSKSIDSDRHVCGYTRIDVENGNGSYDAGFSIYSAVWPLLKQYPGHDFQSGLFGTWMFADSENPNIENVWFYSSIEGGLGWWRDTEYPTETPKFIMGAVAVGFSAWANGPGAGKGRDWQDPKGHYGIAQLSPNLLWPPDGVNLKQGSCGELLGYGYLPLPLTTPKTTTAGAPVPTGNQCWTLFMNATNFKGPATFVLPYFYSAPTVNEPRLAGKFLDGCPARQDRHLAMETQYLPWVQATDDKGQRFGRLAPTMLPTGEGEEAIVLHHITAYNREALWDRAKLWFEGGDPADSVIDRAAAHRHTFAPTRGVEWATNWKGLPREKRPPFAMGDCVRPSISDPYSLTFAAQSDLVKTVTVDGHALMQFPEFYRFNPEANEGRGEWVAVDETEVPEATGLHDVRFSRKKESPPQTYVTPDAPDSCWKTPGPVAGPFKAYPGDGSEVTYFWYRFADQPALLNADLSDEEREELQERVEKIHRHWSPDKEYLPPPDAGKLAAIDPALMVTPPEGLEIGYVPIATRQGLRD